MALISNSILVLSLESLDVPRNASAAIRTVVHSTTKRLLILVLSEHFGARSKLSRTGSWDHILKLLTFLYVETTRVAQEQDKIIFDANVLLRGTDTADVEALSGWDHVFHIEGQAILPLPIWMNALQSTRLSASTAVTLSRTASSGETQPTVASTYPVVALGGTFDHLHAGHKILLSMAAWISSEKVIVGVTDDALLQKKSNKEVLEPLPVRITRARDFLALFNPRLIYQVVCISDVYGPTAVDPNIQALVVSKETLNGAAAIAKHREDYSLPPLQCFVIDVISATSANLDIEDAETLMNAKLSSTFIREWLVKKHLIGTTLGQG